MIPMHYDEVHDWEGLELWFEGSDIEGEPSVKGRFTAMRIDRDTLPEGLYAYDLVDGDSDDEMWFCALRDIVYVNHAGTFVTKDKIEGTSEYIYLADYSFY